MRQMRLAVHVVPGVATALYGVWRDGEAMTRHLPLLPCFLGLALCVWRPEWVSVAVLALCLCFAMYLDNRGRRADDVEDLEERMTSAAATALGQQAAMDKRIDDMQSFVERAGGAMNATQQDVKQMRGDMEAIRAALGGRAERPRL